MIDLHAHLLPGLDDGPASLAASVEMARAAHEAGIGTVVCTPHMSERYPTEPGAVVEAVRLLAEALEAAGVALEVVPGAEIALPHVARIDDDELRQASLGGGGRCLLLEMPFQGWPLTLPALLADLEIRGYGVIIAHPERAEAIQRAPDRMRDLVGRGALVQLTAG
ncbi:MAG: CpsB/CapC family capsule biosynthesis tyrosine phosphatase, partial [Thermoleophilia bacterium]